MSELGARAESGRCVACNHATVGAWICASCGIGTRVLRGATIDDDREVIWCSASHAAASEQTRLTREVEFEHLSAIQSIAYRDSTGVDDAENQRIRFLFHHANNPSFTLEERRKNSDSWHGERENRRARERRARELRKAARRDVLGDLGRFFRRLGFYLRGSSV